MVATEPPITGLPNGLDEQTQANLRLISNVYPELANPKKPECLELLIRSPISTFPGGSLLLTAEDTCRNFILLIEGMIRIYQIAEDGREVTLYRIQPRDMCLMTLNSLLHNKPFNATARCETTVRALVLKLSDFQRAMEISENFRDLVLRNLTGRVSELTNNFYDLAFQRLDMRLACLLGRLFERAGSSTIEVTHQSLAQELGTTREVISRLLKQFEQQQCITLARGRITLNSQTSLDWFVQQ
ncbi:MAG: Crp/Fnr family transcriptional regulator [Thiohalophilus sp.]|jgi:CRP/FNR family transcriptional regulator